MQNKVGRRKQQNIKNSISLLENKWIGGFVKRKKFWPDML